MNSDEVATSCTWPRCCCCEHVACECCMFLVRCRVEQRNANMLLGRVRNGNNVGHAAGRDAYDEREYV